MQSFIQNFVLLDPTSKQGYGGIFIYFREVNIINFSQSFYYFVVLA